MSRRQNLLENLPSRSRLRQDFAIAMLFIFVFLTIKSIKQGHSEEESQETSEAPASPETRRIQQAEKDWAQKQGKKKRKANHADQVSSDHEDDAQQNPGLRSSSCTDFASYLLNNVLSSAELKKITANEVKFAEFCAGMGTGSQSLAPCLG